MRQNIITLSLQQLIHKMKAMPIRQLSKFLSHVENVFQMLLAQADRRGNAKDWNPIASILEPGKTPQQKKIDRIGNVLKIGQIIQRNKKQAGLEESAKKPWQYRLDRIDMSDRDVEKAQENLVARAKKRGVITLSQAYVWRKDKMKQVDQTFSIMSNLVPQGQKWRADMRKILAVSKAMKNLLSATKQAANIEGQQLTQAAGRYQTIEKDKWMQLRFMSSSEKQYKIGQRFVDEGKTLQQLKNIYKKGTSMKTMIQAIKHFTQKTRAQHRNRHQLSNRAYMGMLILSGDKEPYEQQLTESGQEITKTFQKNWTLKQLSDKYKQIDKTHSQMRSLYDVLQNKQSKEEFWQKFSKMSQLKNAVYEAMLSKGWPERMGMKESKQQLTQRVSDQMLSPQNKKFKRNLRGMTNDLLKKRLSKIQQTEDAIQKLSGAADLWDMEGMFPHYYGKKLGELSFMHGVISKQLSRRDRQPFSNEDDLFGRGGGGQPYWFSGTEQQRHRDELDQATKSVERQMRDRKEQKKLMDNMLKKGLSVAQLERIDKKAQDVIALLSRNHRPSQRTPQVKRKIGHLINVGSAAKQAVFMINGPDQLEDQLDEHDIIESVNSPSDTASSFPLRSQRRIEQLTDKLAGKSQQQLRQYLQKVRQAQQDVYNISGKQIKSKDLDHLMDLQQAILTSISSLHYKKQSVQPWDVM